MSSFQILTCYQAPTPWAARGLQRAEPTSARAPGRPKTSFTSLPSEGPHAVRVSGESNPDLPIQSSARYLCTSAAGYIYYTKYLYKERFRCNLLNSSFLYNWFFLIGSEGRSMDTKYMLHVSQQILKPTSWENVTVILHANNIYANLVYFSLLHNNNANFFRLSLRPCFISTSQHFYFLRISWYNHPMNKLAEALTCLGKQYRICLLRLALSHFVRSFQNRICCVHGT